ncbi:GlxA family transcriptional regulator [Coralloluteibacterium stylophorae]|uniref:Helix-turn-helix domain-containing protein n=1 Tax=Coralloluteibacterium stylophorae TaxID=1776034 RepID=A0A8J8AWU6_9GAMM|nr:helix-turn-helix domain-containing protein [Coralloluteibacterium stylophorae]MBS7457345.1 helix-turn-helix domain-containing protein [Coralloluteibacterium stylophorae]
MAARIALVVYPGFQVLDLAALTVFELANEARARPVYDLELVSHAGGMVRSSAGVDMQTRAIGRRRFDTLLVAGALAVPDAEPGLVEDLRRAAPRTRRIASICTGAFVLAQAGLLQDRRATTHWGLARELQRRHPAVRVEEDRIFVADDGVWTSAGMTACIDLALALLDADEGAQLARLVSRKMVVHYRRTGGQSQFSTLAELEPGSDRVRTALEFARENLREPLSVEQLAAHVHWSPRHFSRAFQAQTGLSPAKAVEKLRMEAARALIEDGERSIGKVALLTGFGDEERMRRAFLRTLGRPPQALLREARTRGVERTMAAAAP